ncbi:hypothetical protein Y032_0189g1192 [Ancylostoma ceylanicum]|uniref:PNPLA domain-containing protein n=1 Tax=Ancylostoma ceylanicum TaxID=53326 RepID=A0A016SQG9_9BILA|nr:hypothetical protein Y032_0189g1192 [Ancylostoma ceylanicum]
MHTYIKKDLLEKQRAYIWGMMCSKTASKVPAERNEKAAQKRAMIIEILADIDTLLTIANSPPTPASATQTKTPWDYQQEAAIQVQKENKENGGERVNLLSLDGGGIRGLVVIQMLSELEKKFGADLLSSFGWLGGTSTGAILALALSQGKSVAHCRSMYFRLKDELFCGERPYDGALLDSFLRSEFGEDTTLADITSKKVMVTTCLANVCPPQLKLLRNYQLQCSDVENSNLGFGSPKNVLVREAARCSSAAPTYFPPFDKKYVDGGLLANNPCPQLLTDVQLVNTSLRMAIGRADGTIVECSRAWSYCISAPFFRYSPNLSFAVELDETDDLKLINIMWGTKVYMNEESTSVGQLIDLLKSCAR